MRYRVLCESPGELSGNGNGGNVEADNNGYSMPWESNEYAGLPASVAFHAWNAERITHFEGSNEPVFNPVGSGIGSYLANVWKTSLEKARQLADKRFIFEGFPIYTRISPKLAMIEDEGFNPEEYGGNWEDYDFMKRWEAGKIIRPVSMDEKILNPTGIGTDPLQDTLYDNIKRREREIDRQRNDTNKRLKDEMENTAANEDRKNDIIGGLGGGAGEFWGAVKSAFYTDKKTNFDIQLIALAGIGGLLLLVLIAK